MNFLILEWASRPRFHQFTGNLEAAREHAEAAAKLMPSLFVFVVLPRENREVFEVKIF